MSLDRKYFPLTNALGIHEGDQVSWERKLDGVMGDGIVKLIWLGIEECVDVSEEDGTVTHLYPALGDKIELA